MMRRSLLSAVIVSAGLAASANAAAISMGNLVVVQAGDGAAALSGTAAASFVHEYTVGGTWVQTLNLPTAVSGANRALTLQGSATSEGFIKLSTNGQYLTLAGYDAVPGTASPATAAAATVNRVVGRIDMAGNVDTTTALTNAHSTSNIRSAVSTNGIDIWTGGTGTSTSPSAPGVTYTTYGSTTATRVNTSGANGTNRRVVGIYNGQLYVSGSTTGGPNFSLNTVGTGLPTTPAAEANIPGLPTVAPHSIYDFWFANPNTLYLADDGTAAAGAGIQKWVLSAGTWNLAYILLNDGTAATGIRGLTGYVDGLGNAVLFGTTNASSANSIVTVTDAGSDVDVATVVATASANTAFRGIEYIVPEPTSLSLIAIAAAGLLARRRNA